MYDGAAADSLLRSATPMSLPLSDSKNARCDVGSIATPVSSWAFDTSISRCGAVTLLWALSNTALEEIDDVGEGVSLRGNDYLPAHRIGGRRVRLAAQRLVGIARLRS